MKVKFKYGIQTYSGTIDEMVYGSYRDGKLCIGREYVYPRLTANNETLGAIGSNLAALWATVSSGYKDDLKTYSQRNGTENVPKTQLPPTSYALFIKMMHAWAKSDPEHIDLASINREDVTELGTYVTTVKNAIGNGYLDSISAYDDLTGAF